MQTDVSSYPLVRGFYGEVASTDASTPDSKRIDAQRQLTSAKASLDSTISAVLMSCPEALDSAYVQGLISLLMTKLKAARELTS